MLRHEYGRRRDLWPVLFYQVSENKYLSRSVSISWELALVKSISVTLPGLGSTVRQHIRPDSDHSAIFVMQKAYILVRRPSELREGIWQVEGGSQGLTFRRCESVNPKPTVLARRRYTRILSEGVEVDVVESSAD